MKKEDIVQTWQCSTAEELLGELNPLTGKLWERFRNAPREDVDWVFRGLARESYPLRPSAFRENAFTPFIRAQVDRPVTSPADQRGLEDHFLVEFCSRADRANIHVPGDRPELRDPRRALPRYDPMEFPPVEKLHMVALAQHYGIPTRLLDWTRYPRVAAYFAVEQIAKAKGKKYRPSPSIDGKESCAVWALNRGLLRLVFQRVQSDPTVHFITAPQATNPNLAAQGGVFTLVQPTKNDVHPLPDVDRAILDLADRIPDDLARHSPFLVKMILPPKEARTALRLLAADDVNASTIWPGLKGVVDAMKENGCAFEWNDHHDRH